MGTRAGVSGAITVLVADDEPDLRLLVRLVLEGAGIAVVAEAEDGDEALALVADLAPPPVPSVMILDNRMPGSSGLAVAEQVLAAMPEQAIILFSAFLDEDVRREAEAVGIRSCVSKADVSRLPAVVTALASADR